MGDTATRRSSAAALTAVFLLWSAPGSPDPVSRPASSPTGVPKTCTATLCAVNAGARTVDVITGIGHALRIVRFQTGEACLIKVGGAVAAMGDLKIGVIVRIHYRSTAGQELAESIETLSPKGQGG